MDSDNKLDHGFMTRLIHEAEPPDSSAVPISVAVNNDDGMYSRRSNPTVVYFEEKAALLESGPAAAAFGSGMAAISTALMAMVKPGDRIICHNDLYYWSTDFITNVLDKIGVNVVWTDMRDLGQLQKELQTDTKLVFFEPISNPMQDVIDIAEVTEISHAANAKVVVDNTFMTPYLMRPMECGVDVVIHSATKYMCGHGDALGGVAIADKKTIQKMVYARMQFGGVLSPYLAFLLLRGIKTLPLRMQRHCSNAMAVAEFLEDHPKVQRVWYPGLESHRDHKTATKYMDQFGGVVGFQYAEGTEAAKAIVPKMKLLKNWYSLGEDKSLIIHFQKDDKKGVPDGFLRLCIGLEDPEDIIGDIKQGME